MNPSLNSLSSLNFMRACDYMSVRPTTGYLDHNNHKNTHCTMLKFDPIAYAQLCKSNHGSVFSTTLSRYRVLSSLPLTSMSYSFFTSSRGDSKTLLALDACGFGDASVGGGGDGVVGSFEWVDKLKDACEFVANAANVTGHKAKEVCDQLTPYAQQVLDSHPYLKDAVVPVGGSITAASLAWLVIPILLRRLHTYSIQGSAALLFGTGRISAAVVSYEKSVWGALEDPVRYLITFMALSKIYYFVAPNAFVSQSIGQTWKGVVVLSFLWFVERWKTISFANALAAENLQLDDKERLLTMEKISSVGLFAIGGMALAEASGVAIQSILTVGGIGGVGTAYAAKDILGDLLSGLSMQFTKPFSHGDIIKAGSIEGEVVEMGLTTISLLDAENFPIIVPNSTISSQVIVNKSRAEWYAFISKIYLRLDKLEEVPQITTDIKLMLELYPKVFLEREAPYCYLSRIEISYAELTLGCNLKNLSKVERCVAEQDILLQSIQIIKQHDALLAVHN